MMTTFVIVLVAFCVVIIGRSVSAVNANANANVNVNVNVNVNGYYSNGVMNNNSCLHCEKEEEYKYLHSVEELKRKATAEEEAKEKAGAGGSKLDDDEDNEDDDYEYDEYDEDEDYEDNEDLEQLEQEEDDEFDREEEDEEEYEYTSEEIEIMERLYEEYCLALSEDLGVDCDEDYELEFKKVVYERYVEWKNTPEDVEEEEDEEEENQEDQEEIDTKGREQDIHEALQRYRLEPSSTPPSLAFRDITDDTTNIALSYIELPARMIGVIKISDALPISSLFKLNNNKNNNKNDEQQQR